MMMETKRVLAAKKAVNTLRLNLLGKANFNEVKQLCTEIKLKEAEIDEDMSREAIIAREVDKTTWRSFCRFGDRNAATPGLILYWIDNGRQTLDEQAMWIESNYSLDVHPSELAEFIINHDRGKSIYKPYQELDHLYSLFKEQAGFNWNRKFVNQHILTPACDMADMPF